MALSRPNRSLYFNPKLPRNRWNFALTAVAVGFSCIAVLPLILVLG